MKSSESGRGKSCGKRVLIIEDNEDIGKILRKRLEDTGFEVETADTGYSVLSKLKSMKAPHVVILDLVLPERSGMELLVSIKGKWPLAKIYIFTAHEKYKKKTYLFREYIFGFFCKTEMAEMIVTIKESEKIK